MKRWATLVLAVCMLLGLAVPCYALEEDGFVYEVLADDTVKITAYNGSQTILTIPQTLGGKTVSTIGERAFANNDTIVWLYFQPHMDLYVEPYAFTSCQELMRVYFGDSFSRVSEGMFADCPRLSYLFANADSLCEIGNGAFDGCPSLKMVANNSYYTYFEDSTLLIGENNEAFTAAMKLQGYLLGDVNYDGRINMIDAFEIYMDVSKGVSYLYMSPAADYNRDGIVNIIDAYQVYGIPAFGLAN